MKKLPDEINIIGKVYSVIYVDNPSDVDVHKRESLWGQIDYWTSTIRIYKSDRSNESIMQTLMHEIIHGVASLLHMKLDADDMENEVDILASAITDTIIRNNLFG